MIELRRKGYLAELRTTISQEIDSLSDVNLSNLESITTQVDYNLSSALKRHQDEINELDKTYRMELTVAGSTFLLSVAAALQPSLFPLAPQWVTTFGGVIGTTSLRSIVQATAKYLRERRKLGKTPIGILWQAKGI